MTMVEIADDLDAWARAEVAAGRAMSVDALIARAVAGYRRQLETFRASLDDAVTESDRDGWVDGADMVAEMERWIAEDRAEASASAKTAE